MAAQYIGVSASTFDQMVKDGRMPPPKRVGKRKIWDRTAIDLAFAGLLDEGGVADNEWDEVLWQN